MYYLVSHVVYQNDVPIFGPIHVVAEFLKLQKKKYIEITAPLTFEGVYTFVDGKRIEKLPAQATSTVFKYWQDLQFITSKILVRKPTEQDTVIAADPLCALPFVVLKVLYDFKLIYYTVDYADQRFDNKIVETVYRLLDRFALWACDQNWCVSTRIVAVREQQGFAKKAVFVPNTNISKQLPKTQKSTYMHKLIYVGRMEKNMFIYELLKIAQKLYSLNKRFSLTLIGGGTEAAEVTTTIKKQKLEKVVTYLGPLSNDQVQKQLAKHGIGLALYGDSKNWNRYGDSMKIREYQQFGLPVITTDVPSNAEEVAAQNAGVVIKNNKVTTAKVVTAVAEIEKQYAAYTKQAVLLAKQNMKVPILEKLLGL